MKIVMPDDVLWDDHHHHSFLPYPIKDNLSDVYLRNIIEYFTNFVSIHEFDSKKNLSNIEGMIPLDIFVKHGIVKILHIGASCSPSEIETYKSLFQEFCDVFS